MHGEFLSVVTKLMGEGRLRQVWSMDYGGGHNKIKYQNAI